MAIPGKTCAACGATAHLQAEKCPKCGAGFSSVNPAGPAPHGTAQPGFQQPLPGQYPYPGAMQPHPAFWPAPKSNVTAGLLALFLGWTGAHAFYLGNLPMGFIILAINLLALPLLLLGIGFLILPVVGTFTFVQAILYFCSNEADFYHKYVVGKRWL
ncbi:MAG: TM2 domain-containing protein [Armatimonadetes bacterium]|nr:TM2 domain-containing protein [Armatimonadota bacterium]MDE2207729.1 TM2 domain-containing protein [Armatimonadota bacterium]